MVQNDEFPSEDMELTTILVVRNIKLSKEFYVDKLGAELFREYGGTSCVVKFLGNWILLATGGDPTEDKPNITFSEPLDKNKVSHSFTIRVNDCIKSYEILKNRKVDFLTHPKDWGQEIRAFFQDPDGHLFEISQYIPK